MKIKDLLNGYRFEIVQGNFENCISEIFSDSRRVIENSIYISIIGFNSDGHDYIFDSIKKGAIAIVSEKILDLPKNITLILVKNSREALAYISSKFYGEPSKNLKLIGITGTNGKTSTNEIIKSLLDKNKVPIGTIGTNGNHFSNFSIDVTKNTKTTPESLELNKILYGMKSLGAKYVSLEVTSHALAMHRVDYCDFEIGVFTNLTPDHLDFHKTIFEYQNAKLKLFKQCKICVLNADEEFSKKVNVENKKIITYGIKNNADIIISKIEKKDSFFNLEIKCLHKTFNTKLKANNFFEIYNFLAAISTCYALGLKLESIF